MVDFQEKGGGGGGWLWNLHGAGLFLKYFLINLKGRVISDGVNIFLKILYPP